MLSKVSAPAQVAPQSPTCTPCITCLLATMVLLPPGTYHVPDIPPRTNSSFTFPPHKLFSLCPLRWVGLPPTLAYLGAIIAVVTGDEATATSAGVAMARLAIVIVPGLYSPMIWATLHASSMMSHTKPAGLPP